jgi:Na+-transporting methylmalonyl-CoA/oxaloacetate decarboxylase gamma subunit
LDDPLVISLVVSGIGMLLLFLALALLHGLMYLMTAVLRERNEGEARGRGQEERSRKQEAGGKGQEMEGGGWEASDRKWRAAVIGVALARAELEVGGIGGPGAEGVGGRGRVSGWRAFHQRRQLTSGVRRGRGQ